MLSNMQHSILSSMRTLKLLEGCKSIQIHALNLTDDGLSVADKLLQNLHPSRPVASAPSMSFLLPHGLPLPDAFEPQIDLLLTPHDYVATLSAIFRSSLCTPDADHSAICLQQCAIFRDPKLFRRSLRSARHHASSVHDKIVLAAWLRYDRREDELVGNSAMDCSGWNIECPRSCLVPDYNPETATDHCQCSQSQICSTSDAAAEVQYSDVEADTDNDMSFCINDGEVRCVRYSIAKLSRPLWTMLYGGFAETMRTTISFGKNSISLEGMKAVEIFSRENRVERFEPNILLELLGFANAFCCDGLKSACDKHLASLVTNLEDAGLLIPYALEETAHLLAAACLQVFLRELPNSLREPSISKMFCSPDGREKLARAGHSSFLLYYFLSQVSIDEDLKSNTTVMLLERMLDSVQTTWQKQMACHQLGVVMLERKEFKDAQRWFELAVEEGHLYSTVGVARAKFKRGHKYSAYKIMNSLISDYSPAGWMYQERSLYCNEYEKVADLNAATDLDPTLSFPYKYRAVVLVEENRFGAAISELNKILGFRVLPDCLELRAWILIAMEDYESALRDVRALLTLEPNYLMFSGKMHGEALINLLSPFVQQCSQAQCWMQLYDRWSSVDDIGSLSVVYQMLANDRGKSLLQFRQSLLLLRLNCQKAALRSLRLARNFSTSPSERLVYEGWMLYDTGHRDGALAKAERSISIQRSFEAFFLKAYVLADSALDPDSATYVIHLLKEALKCPSDGLRKGQALNNLGSVYVDCLKFELAADCFISALNIKHTRAHQGLARVHFLKDQRKCAYDEMTRLIEKARNNASAYEKRSEYCDRDMAKSDLIIATQLDPTRTYPYRYRAAVLMDERKEAEALAELSRAVGFKPDLQLLYLRAAFYDSLSDASSAVRDCEAALCLDPSHVDTCQLYEKACSQLADRST